MKKISGTKTVQNLARAFKVCGRAAHDALNFIMLNKAQAVLTVLGFFIASFLVTAILLGAHSAMIAEGYARSPLGIGTLTLNFSDCTWIDTESLRSNLLVSDTEAENVVPLQSVEDVEAYGSSKKSSRISVLVTDNTFFDYAAVEVTSGRAITSSEVNSRSAAAVISEQAASELFGDSDPIGQQVKLNNQLSTVTGIFKGVKGFEPGSLVIVPYRSSRILLGAADVSTYVYVGVRDEDALRSSVEGFLSGRKAELQNSASKHKDYGYSMDYSSGGHGAANTIGIVMYIIMLVLSGAGLLMFTLYPSDGSLSVKAGVRRYSKPRVILTYSIACAVLSVFGSVCGIVLGIFAGFLYCLAVSLSCVISISLFSVSLTVLVISLLFGAVVGIVPGIKNISSMRHDV